ncbi:MAG: chorismate mutase, partial [Clostridia bacterium]|nr:chorismate mutase [Clostridia bacterium]
MIDLETSRQIIDTLDKILVSTYATRMEVVKSIGEYKKKNNIP